MSQEVKTEYKAHDGKSIFCAVEYAISEQSPSDKAVVLVHGLTGYPYVYAFQVASRYFAAQGYDVYRPALYWAGENHRNLAECTTSMHTKDVQSVIDALRPNYKKLYVAGHSLAGTSLIGLTHSADAYSFWDCDYSPWDDTWSHARYDEKIDAYYVGWGSRNVISKDMVEEAKATPESAILSQLSIIEIPSQVIATEFGQSASGKKIFAGLTCEKKLEMLNASGHTFVENNSADRLAVITHHWFERF